MPPSALSSLVQAGVRITYQKEKVWQSIQDNKQVCYVIELLGSPITLCNAQPVDDALSRMKLYRHSGCRPVLQTLTFSSFVLAWTRSWFLFSFFFLIFTGVAFVQNSAIIHEIEFH